MYTKGSYFKCLQEDKENHKDIEINFDINKKSLSKNFWALSELIKRI